MELSEIRKQIDDTDDGLLELFLKRMELSDTVAEYKRAHSLPILNREREREILADVSKRSGDMELYAYQFFKTLMDLSKARQAEQYSSPTAVGSLVRGALLPDGECFPRSGIIACQGVEGANSQAACDRLFTRGNIVYVKTFAAVFDAVESGLCDFGVLPIENSTGGTVRTVYDELRRRSVSIVRSTRLCIRHELLAKPGTELGDIKEIFSHEQAIEQCSGFLSTLSGVKITPCANTAVAAKMVAEAGDSHVAAISSHPCSELYGLVSVAADIQNNSNNYTRFICIKKDAAIYAGAGRISLMISCPNRPGALYDILSRFAALGVNMNKLESYPVVGSDFEYQFFIELDANVREPGVLPMLEELERTCTGFRFLGNYSEV